MLSLLRRQESSGTGLTLHIWIPAFAGMTAFGGLCVSTAPRQKGLPTDKKYGIMYEQLKIISNVLMQQKPNAK